MTPRRPRFVKWSRWFLHAMALAGWAFAIPSLRAAAPDAADAQRELLAGNYSFVLEHGAAAIRDSSANSDWFMVLVRAQLAVGRNAAAATTIADGLSREPSNIRLRWLARDVA